MKKIPFIVFRREADSEHYLFNSSECINVMPGPKGLIWNNHAPIHKELREALFKPRKKLMVIDKLRYHIVSRGNLEIDEP